MKNPKLGQAVTWRTGAHGSILMEGHIEAISGEQARVRTNGNLYELRLDQMRPVYICVVCGKSTANSSRVRYYCSLRCRSADIRLATDDIVLETIIKFKTEHDGFSPNRLTIAKITGISEMTVRRSIKRLVADGRLEIIKPSPSHEGFIVPGGRWVYEGNKHD